MTVASSSYVAKEADGISRLYVRPLDRFESSVVPGSEGARQAFLSPDGGRVGFFAGAKLLTASLAGGTPVPIADAGFQTFGATWGEDDTIVFVPTLVSGLLSIPASGGKPQRLDGARRSGKGIRARLAALSPRRTHAAVHDLGRRFPGRSPAARCCLSAPERRP